MENKMAIKVINDFFNEKIETVIAAKFKSLLSDFKKKDELKTTIDNLEKRYDAIEYNQWMKEKLNSLVLLLEGSDESVADALTGVNQTLMHFEKGLNPIDLSETLKKELTKTKKLLRDKIKKESLNFACANIMDEKQIKDNEKKTVDILDLLSKENSKLSETIHNIKQEAQQKFEITQWIDDASKNAENVSIDVTHISKLTHSSAKGSNLNSEHYKAASSKPNLTTANGATELPKDFAYKTATYSPIADFLQTACNGEMLGVLICKDTSILKHFAEDDVKADLWQAQFRLAFHEKRKSTHEFLKQVYYPVSSGYHLLTPLVSSSLAQIIHDRIWQTRQKNMEAREARHNGLYFNQTDIMYLETAVLRTTQTNHQNASNLNAKRRGQLLLLAAQPPEWKKQLKPPTKAMTIFNKELVSLAKDPIEKLKNLLLAIKSKELGINLKRKQLIAELVSEITEVLFDRVSAIQGQKNNAGWSLKSNLPVHQQYWLDPFRDDKNFQTSRNDIDWPKDITNDFAKWLNLYLKNPNLTLGIAQEKHWRKLFKPLLREFNAVAEASFTEADRIKETIA